MLGAQRGLLVQAGEAVAAERRARVVHAVVEAERDDVVAEACPRWRSQLSAVMPCERSSLSRSAISSSSVVTIPPSPMARFLFEKKLKAEARPTLPTWRPSMLAPIAWAASWSSITPWRSAMAATSRSDPGCPP